MDQQLLFYPPPTDFIGEREELEQLERFCGELEGDTPREWMLELLDKPYLQTELKTRLSVDSECDAIEIFLTEYPEAARSMSVHNKIKKIKAGEMDS